MNLKQRIEAIRRGLDKIRQDVALNTVTSDSANLYCEDLRAQDVAALLKTLKDCNEEADEIKKIVGKVYDHVRIVNMPEAMDRDGVDSPFTVVGVGKIVLTDDIRVKPVNQEVSKQWLRDTGNGDMITQTVNSSSLSALIRRMMRDGEEIPDDVYTVTPFTRAVINKV